MATSRTLLAAATLCFWSCAASSGMAGTSVLERCPEVELPVDLDPSDPASVQRAVRGGPPLLYALGPGRRQALKHLLESGEDPNACALGSSLLSVAAQSGDTVAVEMLLDAGARPDDPRDTGGGTPLMVALAAGRFDVARLLLAHRADPRATTDGGMTTLHQLAMASVPSDRDLRQQQQRLAKHLVSQGVPVDALVSIPRSTPLMLAAVRGNVDLAALLLAQGANRLMRNARGATALDLAEKSGKSDVARLLRQQR